MSQHVSEGLDEWHAAPLGIPQYGRPGLGVILGLVLARQSQLGFKIQ